MNTNTYNYRQSIKDTIDRLTAELNNYTYMVEELTNPYSAAPLTDADVADINRYRTEIASLRNRIADARRSLSGAR